MKKRKVKNKFNISNKLAYTLIALSCILLLGVGVYAYGTANPPVFGHSAEEINLLGGIEGNAVFNDNIGIGTINPLSPLTVGLDGFGTGIYQGDANTAIYGHGDKIGVEGESWGGTESGTIGVKGSGTVGVFGDGGTYGLQGNGISYGVYATGWDADVYAARIGYKFPDGSLQKTSSIPTTGTGPFCMFAKVCPNGWTDNGLGGYIYNSAGGATCPYTVGGEFNNYWDWCNPRICCHS